MVGETFEARGAGGVVWTFDEPAPGSRAAELLDEQYRKGELVRLDKDGNDVAYVAPEGEEVVVTVPPQRASGTRKKAATKPVKG
jgi:hypothetical protein